MLANKRNFTVSRLSRYFAKIGTARCGISLLRGGPIVPDGLMTLLKPILFPTEDVTQQCNLVEVDIHQQSIPISDYLRFFPYRPSVKQPDPLPLLQVLKVTLHEVGFWYGSVNERSSYWRESLDRLCIRITLMQMWSNFKLVFETLRNVRSVIWRDSASDNLSTSSYDILTPGVQHMDLPVSCKMFKYLVTKKGDVSLLPDLKTLCLRVDHTVLMRKLKSNVVAEKFPSVEITYAISSKPLVYTVSRCDCDSDESISHLVVLFRGLYGERLGSTSAALNNIGKENDIEYGSAFFKVNKASCILCRLEDQQQGTWVANQLVSQTCETFILRVLPSSNIPQHMNGLFTDHVLPTLKKHITTSNMYLRKVVLPASVFYYATSTEELHFPSIGELIIEDDFALALRIQMTGYHEKEFPRNTVQLLKAFPNLHTLKIETNELLDWLHVDALPCKDVSTLVIGSARKPIEEDVYPLRTLLNYTAPMSMLTTLILQCPIFDEDISLVIFGTSLKRAFLYSTIKNRLSATDLEEAYKGAPNLQCLFTYCEATKEMLALKDGEDHAEILQFCPTNIVKQLVYRWPEFYGVLWRHMDSIKFRPFRL